MVVPDLDNADIRFLKNTKLNTFWTLKFTLTHAWSSVNEPGLEKILWMSSIVQKIFNSLVRIKCIAKKAGGDVAT